MNPADPASSTPKRKRNSPLTDANKLPPTRLSTTGPGASVSDEESGCESPRTEVAHRFQGLDLEGGPISKLDLKSASQMDGSPWGENAPRKRTKTFEDENAEVPETPQGLLVSFNSNDKDNSPPEKIQVKLQKEDEAGPVIFKGLGAHSRNSASKLSRSYPSINRLADSKSRCRKRASTPPFFGNTDTSNLDNEDMIVESDRAALTWHDNEITGHDPSDPEDDGEGINGIGFKPTPAEARARAERRRQQMAEYKSREMREARAKRSERRRGDTSLGGSSKEAVARRVRFSEAEANAMITTS